LNVVGGLNVIPGAGLVSFSGVSVVLRALPPPSASLLQLLPNTEVSRYMLFYGWWAVLFGLVYCYYLQLFWWYGGCGAWNGAQVEPGGAGQDYGKCLVTGGWAFGLFKLAGC
jgi:hypothetical protein